jgi:hypothetical protein
LKSVVTDPNLFKSGKLFSNDTLGTISWNGREHNRLFCNENNEGFCDIGFGLGVDTVEDGRSTVFFDMDNDGDLDLLVANIDDNHPARLFRNDEGNRRSWLEVRPVSAPGNIDAVGATVRVRAGGREMVRPVVAGQGYQTSYSGPVHFGLGGNEKADVVQVVFQDGTEVTLNDVPSRQTLTVYRDGRITNNPTPSKTFVSANKQ